MAQPDEQDVLNSDAGDRRRGASSTPHVVPGTAPKQSALMPARSFSQISEASASEACARKRPHPTASQFDRGSRCQRVEPLTY